MAALSNVSGQWVEMLVGEGFTHWSTVAKSAIYALNGFSIWRLDQHIWLIISWCWRMDVSWSWGQKFFLFGVEQVSLINTRFLSKVNDLARWANTCTLSCNMPCSSMRSVLKVMWLSFFKVGNPNWESADKCWTGYWHNFLLYGNRYIIVSRLTQKGKVSSLAGLMWKWSQKRLGTSKSVWSCVKS